LELESALAGAGFVLAPIFGFAGLESVRIAETSDASSLSSSAGALELVTADDDVVSVVPLEDVVVVFPESTKADCGCG
jgi:hypothetical protein